MGLAAVRVAAALALLASCASVNATSNLVTDDFAVEGAASPGDCGANCGLLQTQTDGSNVFVDLGAATWFMLRSGNWDPLDKRAFQNSGLGGGTTGLQYSCASVPAYGLACSTLAKRLSTLALSGTGNISFSELSTGSTGFSQLGMLGVIGATSETSVYLVVSNGGSSSSHGNFFISGAIGSLSISGAVFPAPPHVITTPLLSARRAPGGAPALILGRNSTSATVLQQVDSAAPGEPTSVLLSLPETLFDMSTYVPNTVAEKRQTYIAHATPGAAAKLTLVQDASATAVTIVTPSGASSQAVHASAARIQVVIVGDDRSTGLVVIGYDGADGDFTIDVFSRTNTATTPVRLAASWRVPSAPRGTCSIGSSAEGKLLTLCGTGLGGARELRSAPVQLLDPLTFTFAPTTSPSAAPTAVQPPTDAPEEANTALLLGIGVPGGLLALGALGAAGVALRRRHDRKRDKNVLAAELYDEANVEIVPAAELSTPDNGVGVALAPVASAVALPRPLEIVSIEKVRYDDEEAPAEQPQRAARPPHKDRYSVRPPAFDPEDEDEEDD